MFMSQFNKGSYSIANRLYFDFQMKLVLNATKLKLLPTYKSILDDKLKVLKENTF